MHHRHRPRVLACWLASLAFLLATLAPAVAQALAAKASVDWVEVCSGSRVKLVQADAGGDQSAPQPKQAHLFEHCPFCGFHLDAAVWPPMPVVEMAPPNLTHVVPRAWLHAPRTLHAWVLSQPRAPPTFG